MSSFQPIGHQHLQQPISYHHLLLKEVFLILMCVVWGGAHAQDGNGFRQYFYPDGTVSSEGYVVDGKPAGTCRTSREQGALKSEGNRVGSELENTWRFHGPDGQLLSTIAYQDGLKNGPQRKFAPDSILVSEELFQDGLKDGPSTTFYPDGSVHTLLPYELGKEHGRAKEFADDGRLITITDWRSGVLQRRQAINRHDEQGLRQGPWQGYYPGGALMWEGRFVDDKRQGIFKEYDKQGNLKDLAKYDQDEFLPDAAETTLLDIRNTYHPNGTVASIGSYTKDGRKEGLFRAYDAQGKPTEASIFRNNVLVGAGAVSEAG